MRFWKFIIAVVCITACISSVQGQEFSKSTGTETIQHAQKEGKHLFLFFYRDSSPLTQQMSQVFDEAIEELGSEFLSMKIEMSNPKERDIIKKFDLQKAPMPLAIVLAPNGIMIKGFPKHFTKDQLVASLVTPGMAACLKALQEQKLVLLCLQGNNTKNNETAMQGVKDFQADTRFAKQTQIILINPTDEAEKTFLQELGLDSNLQEATTLMMLPPGQKVGSFVGPTSKQMLISTLTKATQGCVGGCCPGGCN